MELLAPAGGMDSVAAAVQGGANAIYMGLGTLNARRGASNFDEQGLLQAVSYARAHHVHVHLTLNTLLFENEMAVAVSALRTACAAGVHAVIVQDLAVAQLLRTCAPEIRLHASTQMGIHNLAGVLQLARMGFSRVVLARELSLAEIRAICAQAPIEIEVFCHGALCMGLSGQCMMSAMAGGRSGNRGLCAQTCRMRMAGGAENGYALSLKDLSLLTPQRMRELEQAGVHAVKIEGRMKSPTYVYAAVRAARTALSGENPDTDALRAAFSRSGFTDGYITGRRGKDMFGVRTAQDTQNTRLAAQTAKVSWDVPALWPQAVKPVAFIEAIPPPPTRRPSRLAPPALRVALADPAQLTPALASLCERIALYPDMLLKLLETPLGKANLSRLCVRQPVASFEEERLRAQLRTLRAKGIENLMVSGLSGVYLGQEMGFTLCGGHTLHITNTSALAQYGAFGLSDCTLSLEISAAKLAHLGSEVLRGIVGYGRMELMTMRCCPVRESKGCKACKAGVGVLTDAQHRRFPVSCRSGVAQLFNCAVLDVADKQDAFKNVDFIWLYFTQETAREVLELTRRFTAQTPPLSMDGRTRGLYFRKVL